ncbi:putative kinase [Streptomyces ambofaciens ATCC 23877]|uniref:Putative kinase n=1 Tax=Streptomyces ambofaciens (strain ATCC 23877 / 3486 / DSM 40053 / JCM 4204 / NBRC 12836 / NRRL B-2516) TaxID=278992 RepID=Q1RRE0_STRA7|nr:ATP-binding protein [Streptomyces ambofaciens]AKZ53311.1 putative kinase [Streptomyces ambofaciens ATCC 23877]CAI78148.1 putative kinase [Streptomyces ambofaciens ATCC 23877]CAJ89206.1 putative kinase [Streptomyces ambofaciens ATCC 23877]
MKASEVTAPVVRTVTLKLPADTGAMPMARIRGRTLLTVLDWPGNVHAATDVLGHLVDNAVQHGHTPETTGRLREIRVWLRVTEAHELIIDVADPHPGFEHFTDAVNGCTGRSLWNVRQQGAHLSWFLTPQCGGKTVRATMTAASSPP